MEEAGCQVINDAPMVSTNLGYVTYNSIEDDFLKSAQCELFQFTLIIALMIGEHLSLQHFYIPTDECCMSYNLMTGLSLARHARRPHLVHKQQSNIKLLHILKYNLAWLSHTGKSTDDA